jgi:hypothetical protein
MNWLRPRVFAQPRRTCRAAQLLTQREPDRLAQAQNDHGAGLAIRATQGGDRTDLDEDRFPDRDPWTFAQAMDADFWPQ